MLARLLLLTVFAVPAILGAPGRSPAGAETPLSDREASQLMYSLIRSGGDSAQALIDRVVDRGDRRFIAVFIEMLGAIGSDSERDRYAGALRELSGQDFGRDWVAWLEWCATTELQPPPGFTAWKGAIFGRIDPRFRDFLHAGAVSTIRVEEIVWGGVPVDGIPPLEDPSTILAAAAAYLDPGEPVFGLVVNGEARAYPLRIMDHHEMANDVVGGEPVTLAYCTLCGAGIAYRAVQPDGSPFTFGTSGLLYRSNKLMYDRQTKTLWNQLTGVPVVGELAGSGIRLEVLPVVVASWKDWSASHPDTLVLDIETGIGRDYSRRPYADYFSSAGTWFPAAGSDPVLEDKARVFALEVGGEPKAYPLDSVLEERVINDSVGGRDIVIIAGSGAVEVSGSDRDGVPFAYSAGAAVRAYERGGRRFGPGPEPGTLSDEAGEIWQISEEALAGPGGERLPRLPGHLAYWFGWSAFHPDSAVYGSR